MTTTSERGIRALSDLIAEEIRVALTRRRMSQRQLAVQLGVSPAWLNYRLTGVQEIGVNDLQRIAAALGVNVLDLFPGGRDAARRQRDPNDSLRQLPHPAAAPRPNVPRPVGRAGRRSVLGVSPLSGGRRDSTRPVSGVPASRRRPAPTGPGNRPIPA